MRGVAIPSIESENIYIPLTVLAELKAGAVHGEHAKKRLEGLNIFLSENQVQISHGITIDMTETYAHLYDRLRVQGTPISPNDLWIATECLYHDLTLATFDKDFEHVPDLRLFNQ